MSSPQVLWNPSSSFKDQSNLSHYLKWLNSHKSRSFRDYDQLWQWSVDHPEDFWRSIWEYFKIESDKRPGQVLSGKMPDARWFENAELNYTAHIFRNKSPEDIAIISKTEGEPVEKTTWKTLEQQTAALSSFFRQKGIETGDRVVAFLPNIQEATVGLLAAGAVGAVWSSCSPDFGAKSVIDRFQQIEPKVLITCDGYQYNGKPYDKTDTVKEIIEHLPSLEVVIVVSRLSAFSDISIKKATDWNQIISNQKAILTFRPLPFNHPIWVLYSSGTTGQPKAITHSVGGILLEHFKYLSFHNDVKPGDKFFWYSTTGWMMWNFVQSALLLNATIVLYDGSPAFPDINALWQFAEEVGINHFGTSAPYIMACLKKDIHPGQDFDLTHLKSLSSTGSPLPPRGFDWIYKKVKKDLWVVSMSGGTDVCSAFVGGCPLEPVYQGEIQRRALGCALYAYDEEGNPIVGDVGEMVITKPMPSMPIYFWNDYKQQRYLESYFEVFPGIWRHGDWLQITERNTLIILGRSDATLNRHGIRIGTAEIYQVVDKQPEIKDSIIVNLEMPGGKHFMPLFVVLNTGFEMDEALIMRLNAALKKEYTPRHVPDAIIPVEDIPYTISGKKMEAPVKKLLLGRPLEKSVNKGAMRNPESLEFFIQYGKQIKKEQV
jgi:acetoacetyl-CoA synthetase